MTSGAVKLVVRIGSWIYGFVYLEFVPQGVRRIKKLLLQGCRMEKK